MLERDKEEEICSERSPSRSLAIKMARRRVAATTCQFKCNKAIYTVTLILMSSPRFYLGSVPDSQLRKPEVARNEAIRLRLVNIKCDGAIVFVFFY